MESFNKIIGYKNIKLELERLADQMKNSEKYKKIGAKTTHGLLLEGQPGVGKTLMAECLIKESGRKSFTIRKNVSEPELINLIKTTFEKAKNHGPSIVYLDDVDKFSNEDQYHKNTQPFITLQSCIDDVKDCEVFVLATANVVDCFPGSLLRPGRFDKVITINNPRDEDAEKICEYYLKQKKLDKGIDSKTVARLLNGGTTAELETVINEAAVYAAFDNRPNITMNDLINSFLRVVYKAPETLSETSNDFITAVATHEAGHITVAEVLEPESVSLATIKNYDSKAGGFVSFKNNKNYWHDLSFSETRVMQLLAGKAATEIILGKQDIGANEDLERATKILERLSTINGVYGFEYLRSSRSGDESDKYFEKKSNFVHSQLEIFYQRVKKILIDNKELLNKLIEELINKKTLTYIDIKKIKEDLNYKD